MAPVGGNRYRIRITGRLLSSDMDALQREAVAAIARAGKIRLFVELRQFEGWEAHDNWSNLGFYARHGDDIERIAIVGDEAWRSEALMFAGADLRKGPVEYFRPADAGRARAWLET
jgi:hypothetical protein